MEPILNVGVVLASVREGRRGEPFAGWIHGLLAARPGVNAELLDLRDWALPSFSLRDPPSVAEKSYDPASLPGRWGAKVASLDAFVIVTPEYNHGYSGALKNAIDQVYRPWGHKPVGFVGYGGFAAGARAVEQLRLVAVELRMVPIRDEVNLRLVGFAADERGWPKEESYARKAAAMIDDLLWWAWVSREGRERHPR